MTEISTDEVRQLAEWLRGSDISLLELSGPGKLIRLRRDRGDVRTTVAAHAPEAMAAEAPSEAPPATVVRATSVGVVLHAHPLRQEPLVSVGQEVAAGQIVALLRVGTLLLPVTSPRAGTVSRMVAANESVVGFGDPLIELA